MPIATTDDDRRVLQQQVPPDEPGGELPEHHVAVGVGRTRLRDQPGELGVGERRRRARHTRDQERDHHRRPRGLVRDRPGQREDPRADDAADADRGQLPEPERAIQPSAPVLVDIVDGLATQQCVARCGHRVLLEFEPSAARQQRTREEREIRRPLGEPAHEVAEPLRAVGQVDTHAAALAPRVRSARAGARRRASAARSRRRSARCAARDGGRSRPAAGRASPPSAGPARP